MNKHLPTINLIAAVAVDGSIGVNDGLLWKIPNDLKYYKAKTWQNIIIIGNKTFKTLPNAALNGRIFFVLSKIKNSSHINDKLDNVHYVSSIKDALFSAKNLATFYHNNIYIAGGGSIYEQMMNYCDYAHITWVDKIYQEKADKFFPIKKFLTNFELISESIWHGKYAKMYPPYKFTLYKKKKL